MTEGPAISILLLVATLSDSFANHSSHEIEVAEGINCPTRTVGHSMKLALQKSRGSRNVTDYVSLNVSAVGWCKGILWPIRPLWLEQQIDSSHSKRVVR